MYWVLAAVLAIPVLAVVAWGMWLRFCRSITQMHGIEALKAAPPIARAFPVTQWMAAIRHVGPVLMELLGRNQPPPPSALPPPQQQPALPPGPDGSPPTGGPAP